MLQLASLVLLAATQVAPSPAPAQAPPLPAKSFSCAPATGFVGTLCAPAAPGKHPVMLLLGGSEGGDSLGRSAADFADNGYVAASIAYFGAPGLPQSLQEVPVETIGTALAAIEKRDDVDPKRIAIFGISAGGELALLAASTYKDIHAVIADVPSPFAWEGIPRGVSADDESMWTLGGKPVPYVPFTPAMRQVFETAFSTHVPLDLRPAYDDAMKNTTAVNAAFFHLENINGPVLFLSAGDDRIWNSIEQSRLGLAYLQRMHHPFADQVEEYPSAGHVFLFATPERPLVSSPFIGGLTLSLGGTPDANVTAAADAWERIATFLATALKPR